MRKAFWNNVVGIRYELLSCRLVQNCCSSPPQQPCSRLVSDVCYRKRNDDPSYLPRLHSFSLVSITYYIPRISTDYFDVLSCHTYDVVVFVCLFWYIIRLAGPGWKSRGHQADSTTPRREDTVSSIPPQPDKPNNTDHRWERWSSFREQYWEDPSPSEFLTLLLDGDYPKSSSGCNGDVQCLVLNITGNIVNLREYSSYKFHNGRCRLRAA